MSTVTGIPLVEISKGQYINPLLIASVYVNQSEGGGLRIRLHGVTGVEYYSEMTLDGLYEFMQKLLEADE